jgi:hypothetical protein
MPAREVKTKVCTRCKKRKPIAQFRLDADRASGFQPWCKPCKTAYGTAWTRSKKHGKDPGWYDAQLAAQGGVCAICRRASANYVTDHSHDCCPGPRSCGRCVRGLICPGCNLILGHAHDTTVTLAAAWLYLVDDMIRRAREQMEGAR